MLFCGNVTLQFCNITLRDVTFLLCNNELYALTVLPYLRKLSDEELWTYYVGLFASSFRMIVDDDGFFEDEALSMIDACRGEMVSRWYGNFRAKTLADAPPGYSK